MDVLLIKESQGSNWRQQCHKSKGNRRIELNQILIEYRKKSQGKVKEWKRSLSLKYETH